MVRLNSNERGRRASLPSHLIGSVVSCSPINATVNRFGRHERLTAPSTSTASIHSTGVFITEGIRQTPAKMKLAILCLCLASTASAAPSFFHYLPHLAGTRPQVAPSQVRTPLTAPLTLPQLPQPGLPGAYSVELIYPHRFPGAAGVNPAQPFPTHGFIKYSIPQPPGRQSVEVYYPYDFSQQRILTNLPPMANVPHMPNPNVLPFEFPPQIIPQQIPNLPAFDVNPLPSQDPLPPLQQDLATQTSQVTTKA
ncbi:secretory calcium-binding phosphoprotein 5 [Nelusetta ayraudi]|uniref:secretory calcium-binding phosphoprotein 5 n=1 Tax=Nelusetta ayraudi TaxID=303726 RepID=UPI003F71F960